MTFAPRDAQAGLRPAVRRRLRGWAHRAAAILASEAPPINWGPVLDALQAQRQETATRHAEFAAEFSGLVTTVQQAQADLAAELTRQLAAVHADGAGLATELERTQTLLRRTSTDLARAVQTAAQTGVVEGASLHNLHRLVEVDREVPAPGGYAATPQTVLRLVSVCLDLPANRQVVECGSGSSTVWLALACRQAGSGRVVALEHEDTYAARTREAIQHHRLSAWADVRVAPLEEIDVAGTTYPWYARSTWADLGEIDLLFVDGPPRATGLRARYPALPLLGPALVDGAVVALDDIHRADERGIVDVWLDEGADGIRLSARDRCGRTEFFRAARLDG